MDKLRILLAVILIIVVAFLSYVLIFGLSFEGKESDFYVPTVIGDNISTYKNSCSELNLSTSFDYNALNGKKVKVKGQIYKKMEFVQFDKTRTDITLKVPQLSPEPYMVITYTGTIPYNINDTIKVYGVWFYPICIDSPPELANIGLAGIKAGYIEKISSNSKAGENSPGIQSVPTQTTTTSIDRNSFEKSWVE